MTYDQKCYDLAEAFLSDEPNADTSEHRHVLAQRIQSAIEDYLAELTEAEYPAALRRKGERLWVVALYPPVEKVDDDKYASLKREILAEIPNFLL